MGVYILKNNHSPKAEENRRLFYKLKDDLLKQKKASSFEQKVRAIEERTEKPVYIL